MKLLEINNGKDLIKVAPYSPFALKFAENYSKLSDGPYYSLPESNIKNDTFCVIKKQFDNNTFTPVRVGRISGEVHINSLYNFKNEESHIYLAAIWGLELSRVVQKMKPEDHYFHADSYAVQIMYYLFKFDLETLHLIMQWWLSILRSQNIELNVKRAAAIVKLLKQLKTNDMKTKTTKNNETGFVFFQDRILSDLANVHAVKVAKTKTAKGEEWISLGFFINHPSGKIVHRDVSFVNYKLSGSGAMVRQEDILDCLKRNKIKLTSDKKDFSFSEALKAMSMNDSLKFRGVDWPKIHSYIQLQYTKTKTGKVSQPYIALVLKNGGEMIHPYIPSSYDMLAERFVLVK